MFSHLSASHSVHKRGACMAGGMHGGGGWQRACMAGACMMGCMHGRGYEWQGGGVRGRTDGHCSGRYASYWNAFLSVSCFSVIEVSFLTAGQFLII